MISEFSHLSPLVAVFEVSLATCGIVCGEFLDESIRASEEGRTKTNGVAMRGERDSVRFPSGAAESKDSKRTRSEGSWSDLSGSLLG